MMNYEVEVAPDVVFTKGEQDEMSSTKDDARLINRPLNEEDDLDFNKIQETAKNAQKQQKNETSSVKKITQSELRSIPIYIKDISRYVKKYASSGKMKFEYDCQKLSPACFLELASQFKQKYPMFFLLMNYKTQTLTVDWSGKNEV